ncbi:MAG: hypothetical protein GY700_10790, partial [Propionibacteriaceae bacterium]|nr:hypothetical protein [Propionibacteriaceae bacterium]
THFGVTHFGVTHFVVDSEYCLRVIQQANTHRPCAINKDIIHSITQELEARCHRVVFVRTPSHCIAKGIQPNALSRGNDIADLAADGGRQRSAATPELDPEPPRRHWRNTHPAPVFFCAASMLLPRPLLAAPTLNVRDALLVKQMVGLR